MFVMLKTKSDLLSGHMISEETDSSHVINEHTDKVLIHFFSIQKKQAWENWFFSFQYEKKIDFEKKNCEIKVIY